MHRIRILSVAKNRELGYNKLIYSEKVGEHMQVLVINGSPKGSRSNTYRLTQAFLEGLSPSETRERTVNRLDIKPCLGCFACWNKTPGKCCISDDMAAVLEDMLWADVILWSFPLYYFSVPGPLKNLMDRQLPLVLPFMAKDTENGGHPTRYDMSRKRHVVISTCGFYTAQGNYDGVNALFDHLCGKGNFTPIYCGQGELFRVKELSQRTDEYLAFVRDAGREFAAGGISRETQRALSQLLYPREVFEAMADASWGVAQTGEKPDKSLVFTRQMAALYNKAAYPGHDLVLEMYYTDLNQRYQILLTQEGSQVLTSDFRDYTTRIETTFALWKAIAAGEENGQDALMQQKYRVQGDFSLMIQWSRYFGGEQTAAEEPKPVSQPTNMNLLLIPWIAFWVAAAIDSFWGAAVSILITAGVPLLYHKNKRTLYDSLTTLLVTACALLLLTGVSARWVLPLSYLCFGLMWFLSCFRKLPLTAHYSVNDYGGGMLENPLFLKTNRILTACWGVLYLLSSVWTWFILGNARLAWLSILNSILPALMGVFTVWFQKWYPAKVARGK